MRLPQLTALLQLFVLVASTSGSRVRRQIVFEDDDDDERSNRPPNSDCITPDREQGVCMRWRNCLPLRQLNNWNRLQPYVCGFAGNEPLVCCPLEDDLGDPDRFFTTTRRTTRRTTPTRRRTTTRRPAATTRRPSTTTRRTSTATRRTSTTTRRIGINTRRPTVITPRPSNLIEKPRFLPGQCGNGIIETDSRIINGKVAEKGAWPWMAVVFVEKRRGAKSPDCGGALVTRRHVITAAHCVVTGRAVAPMNPSQLSVRLGAHDLSKSEPGAIDVPVEAVRRHERFDPRTYKNDIAVLRLNRAVPFSNLIAPVCLPYDSLQDQDITDKSSTVVGFGTIAFNGPSSDLLRQVSFDIQDQQYCRQAYERELNITEEYMCAGTTDGSKDSCQGDSGGPLVTLGKETRYYLVGVVSFGKLCAQPGYPGVYTRVTKYLDWLRSNLAE